MTIQDFKGKTLVSIREYYTKGGKELPSSKGLSFVCYVLLCFFSFPEIIVGNL